MALHMLLRRADIDPLESTNLTLVLKTRATDIDYPARRGVSATWEDQESSLTDGAGGI